jgi:hypothetical protein
MTVQRPQTAQKPLFKLGSTVLSSKRQAIEALDALKQDQYYLIEKCCLAIRFYSGQGSNQ